MVGRGALWMFELWTFEPGMFEPGLPGPVGPDMGPPPGFVAFGVLAVLVGIGTTLWRVSLARRVARDAGLDPDRATELTLLEDDGLEASYLSAHLQARPVAELSPDAPAPRSTEERLKELCSLLEQGLISQEEHDARRKAVLDAL